MRGVLRLFRSAGGLQGRQFAGISGAGRSRQFHSSTITRAGKYSKEYNFHVPHVARVHQIGGEVMMTVMWLWIFYRAKKDLVYVLGLRHPWDDH